MACALLHSQQWGSPARGCGKHPPFQKHLPDDKVCSRFQKNGRKGPPNPLGSVSRVQNQESETVENEERGIPAWGFAKVTPSVLTRPACHRAAAANCNHSQLSPGQQGTQGMALLPATVTMSR